MYSSFLVGYPKLRRESAHARTFGGDFELKSLRMCGFSAQLLKNGSFKRSYKPANGRGRQSGFHVARGTGLPLEMAPMWLKVRMPIKGLVSQFAPQLVQSVRQQALESPPTTPNLPSILRAFLHCGRPQPGS